jgi:hypothetical protein
MDARAGAVQLRAMRAMTPARRLALAVGWSASVRGMVLSGLKMRHPGASEAHLRFLLAERCYGRKEALLAYGEEPGHG